MNEQQETIILRLYAGCNVNCPGDAPRGQRYVDLSRLRPDTVPAFITYPFYSVSMMGSYGGLETKPIRYCF